MPAITAGDDEHALRAAAEILDERNDPLRPLHERVRLRDEAELYKLAAESGASAAEAELCVRTTQNDERMANAFLQLHIAHNLSPADDPDDYMQIICDAAEQCLPVSQGATIVEVARLADAAPTSEAARTIHNLAERWQYFMSNETTEAHVVAEAREAFYAMLPSVSNMPPEQQANVLGQLEESFDMFGAVHRLVQTYGSDESLLAVREALSQDLQSGELTPELAEQRLFAASAISEGLAYQKDHPEASAAYINAIRLYGDNRLSDAGRYGALKLFAALRDGDPAVDILTAPLAESPIIMDAGRYVYEAYTTEYTPRGITGLLVERAARPAGNAASLVQVGLDLKALQELPDRDYKHAVFPGLRQSTEAGKAGLREAIVSMVAYYDMPEPAELEPAPKTNPVKSADGFMEYSGSTLGNPEETPMLTAQALQFAGDEIVDRERYERTVLQRNPDGTVGDPAKVIDLLRRVEDHTRPEQHASLRFERIDYFDDLLRYYDAAPTDTDAMGMALAYMNYMMERNSELGQSGVSPTFLDAVALTKERVADTLDMLREAGETENSTASRPAGEWLGQAVRLQELTMSTAWHVSGESSLVGQLKDRSPAARYNMARTIRADVEAIAREYTGDEGRAAIVRNDRLTNALLRYLES